MESYSNSSFLARYMSVLQPRNKGTKLSFLLRSQFVAVFTKTAQSDTFLAFQFLTALEATAEAVQPVSAQFDLHLMSYLWNYQKPGFDDRIRKLPFALTNIKRNFVVTLILTLVVSNISPAGKQGAVICSIPSVIRTRRLDYNHHSYLGNNKNYA